ncbi:CRISPR-associated endonuclease Cas1 [Bifidobacterium goeldii]|uniref:CRISPR-associated endonuclease Cas1 n=1 Tax=Bifidobacterium goeldii TaxID=2306975 RepID=A0A430FLM6_9BIFI|nr:hypothetical protein [Bifidobacterium goeldii]RSX53794.1 CRISPR-associated endonuclease Cas1 [Bifidobacterium goeldii]
MSAGRTVPGTPPPELGELVRAEDRLSFAYFEHCVINRADNAITVTDDTGTRHVPGGCWRYRRAYSSVM